MQNIRTRILRSRIYSCSKETVRNVIAYRKDQVQYTGWEKHFNEIPGPLRLPLIGNLHLFSPFGPYSFDKLYDAYEDLHKKYGPIVRLDLGIPIVALFDPNDIQKMLALHDKFPERPLLEALRHHRLENEAMYGGSAGMVAENGLEWQRVRGLVNFIMSPRFVDNYLPVHEEIAADFANLIRTKRHHQHNLLKDFLREIYRYTAESIGVVCFGTRLGLLKVNSSNTAKASQIIKASEDTLQAFADTFLGFPWWKYFKTPAYRKLVKSQTFFYELASECIEKALWNLYENPSNKNLEFIKTLYAKSKGSDIYKASDTDIRLVMSELFSAGIDATGNMIGFILYLLTQNESIQDLVYDEIQKKAPEGRKLTPQTLDSMKYLKAVIKEGYRLTPTAGGIARILQKEVVLSGYKIPAKVLCIGLNPVICKQEKYFFVPQSFKPERWLDDYRPLPKDVKPHPYCVLPFSYGVRSCPGQRLANQEIMVCLIKVLQNFKIKYTGPAIGSKMRLLLIPDKPMDFVFWNRK